MVYRVPDVSRPWNGKPIATTLSPERTAFSRMTAASLNVPRRLEQSQIVGFVGLRLDAI